MPPESWCGYALQLGLGAGDLHLVQQFDGRVARASARDSSGWRMRSASTSWRPMVWTGLSAVIGSCGMRETVRPRIRRAAPGSATTSTPWKRAVPEITASSSGSSRSMPIAVVDLPEPDSPMRVTVSPASMVKLTPSTARTTPRVGDQLDLQVLDLEQRGRRSLVASLVARWSRSLIRRPSSTSRVRSRSPSPSRLTPTTSSGDDQAGEGDQPPGGGDVVLAVGDDAAPGGERPLGSGAEVAQRALQQHGLGEQQQDDQATPGVMMLGMMCRGRIGDAGAAPAPGRRPRTASRVRPAPASGSAGPPRATGRWRSRR